MKFGFGVYNESLV